MTTIRLKIVFGICGTLVTLLSGCASTPAPTTHPGLSTHELNAFIVDCSRREEQILFIQSQRPTEKQRADAAVRNMITPWELFTNTDAYTDRFFTGSREKEWMVNQILLEISKC